MMYENICKLLMKNGVCLVHATCDCIAETFRKLSSGNGFRSRVSLNEKIAFEIALSGSYASKRTACLFTTEGLYEALDPLMSSAYTGVVGGFLIICIKETNEETAPLGLFSKLPFIVAETGKDLARAVEFGYDLSERYETPVIIQTTPAASEAVAHEASISELQISSSTFVKNPERWAATPKFRYKLHEALNDKIRAIGQEFEGYEGNRMVIGGRSGLITDRHASTNIYGKDLSLLYLATLHPIPQGLVEKFIREMDEVFLMEGVHPVIELQIRDRRKVKVVHLAGVGCGWRNPQESMFDFEVTRDCLGPGSSINVAHGRKKLEPQSRLLAITDEKSFFHSGMASIVNAVYNDSSFLILIMTDEHEEEMKKILKGFGLSSCFHIDDVSEIGNFMNLQDLTVLFYRGTV